MGCRIPLFVGDTELSNVRSVKYLGVDINDNGETRTQPDIFDSLLEKLRSARLKPLQRLYFLRTHLLPTYMHKLVHEDFLGISLEKLDKKVRTSVKAFLFQVQGLPNPCIHLKIKYGGLGVSQLRWSIPKLAFQRMRKLVVSKCPFVQFISKTPEFVKEMTRICILAPYNLDYDLRLLRELSTNPANRGFMCFSVGGHIVNRHLSGWTNIPSRQLISMIRLRSGTLGAIHGAPNQPTCHRCLEDTPQSLFHILNCCPKTRGLQTLRHNKIRDMIFDSLIEKRWTVLREHRIPISRTGYIKPDLIAINSNQTKALVLDVRISYELDKDSLSKTDYQKREKYKKHDSAIFEYVRFHFPDVPRTDYYGIIFGSRGSIHNVTLNLLKDTFGLSDLRIGALIDTIMHESMKIYDLFNKVDVDLPDRPSVPD